MSANLNIFELESKKIAVGNVVDFRDTEASRNVTEKLWVLQRIHEKIDDDASFDAF